MLHSTLGDHDGEAEAERDGRRPRGNRDSAALAVQSPEQEATAVVCPFCNTGEPILVSAFGCHHLVSHYRCRGCWTYFDAIRDDK